MRPQYHSSVKSEYDMRALGVVHRLSYAYPKALVLQVRIRQALDSLQLGCVVAGLLDPPLRSNTGCHCCSAVPLTLWLKHPCSSDMLWQASRRQVLYAWLCIHKYGRAPWKSKEECDLPKTCHPPGVASQPALLPAHQASPVCALLQHC